jgi:hypothetical protein
VTTYAWGFFPDPRGPYFYAALLLVILNAAENYAEIVKELNRPSSLEEDSQANPPTESAPTGMDKFLVVVSKATPYLMIITNIAVTIIQIRKGETSAWITLAFTGITFIDTTSWKSKEYTWYLNTVLGYPVAAAALYYANNISRLKILFKLAISNQTLMKVSEWLKAKREELENRLLKLKEEELNQAQSLG